MDRVQIGDRKTALILAVRENHYEGLFLCQNAKTLFLKLHQPFAPGAVAEYLIRNGANLSHQDVDGWCALHHAALKGSIKMVKMMLYAGGNRAQLTNV